MDENLGANGGGYPDCCLCVTIPSTLIHIKVSGQPNASIFGTGKLYGYTKDMDRDSVGADVKLDNLRSEGRRKLHSRDGGKETLA